MLQLARIATADIDAAWVAAVPLMQRIADSAPDLSLAWLWSGLRAGALQLFLAGSAEGGHAAALVCRLEDWKGGTVLRIVGAASDDRRGWFALWPDFAAEAGRMGAARIVFDGRRGWARKIPEARILRQVYEVELR